MENIVEVSSLEIQGNKTRVFIKGWVHSNYYKVVVKSNNQILCESKKYLPRYDINKEFHEKIEDNNYGYEIDETIEGQWKQVDIYLVTKKEEIKILSLDNRTAAKITKKINKIARTFYKAIRFFWREYHFLVPPSMLKKYWNDFRNKMQQDKNANIIYDPIIPSEYQNWLNQKEQIKNIDAKEKDITFILETENNNQIEFLLNYIPKNQIVIWDKNEKWVSKIKTDYLCFLEKNVQLTNRFFSVVSKYLKEKSDLIYTDHDELNESNERVNPAFKPDWSKDTLLGVNYIGQMIIVSKKWIKNINKKEFDCYQILLELRDSIEKVIHIPEVLYSIKGQVSQEKIYKDVINYFKRNKKEVLVTNNTDKKTVTVTYKIKENPLVSIIIPTKDHADILENCLKSIYEKTTYSNFEIIVIDNNSEEEETFSLFKKYAKQKKNFKVERLECKFNYSYINNVAVNQYSSGEYIVLLNNDTEIITPNWLELMLGYAQQPDIGTIGVKLLFPDNTIQHAGIIMGKGGLAGHAHYGKNRNYQPLGYELSIPYNVSGCTAACLMVSKKKFEEVNGLEESLQVAFNDVDFNLKLLKQGYRNIFLPNVELYHYESKSRGLDTTVEKQKRFMQEWQFMEDKWKDKLCYDPYYNYNYSFTEDYKIEIKEEKN